MRNLVSGLYAFARFMNDLTTLLSMNPAKIGRRAKNKVIGRWFWKNFG